MGGNFPAVRADIGISGGELGDAGENFFFGKRDVGGIVDGSKILSGGSMRLERFHFCCEAAFLQHCGDRMVAGKVLGMLAGDVLEVEIVEDQANFMRVTHFYEVRMRVI